MGTGTAQSLNGPLSADSALGTLLAAESLLYAAFSVAASARSSTGKVLTFPQLGTKVNVIAVSALFLIALGAATAWFDLYIEPGFPQDGSERTIGLVLAIAVLIQPILALLSVLAVSTEA
ncbi:MAG: hypothetical protein JWM47_1791 [Acidimicrobiales bacterium]|nr:hypothetical protein [Acidimicrobiales bacterium]